MTIRADILQTPSTASLRFEMHARETQDDWTEARGSQTKNFFSASAGETIVAVLAPDEWTLLDNVELEGHEAHRFRTLIGELTVFGDHRGTDVGSYTGLQFTPGHRIRVVTVKSN